MRTPMIAQGSEWGTTVVPVPAGDARSRLSRRLFLASLLAPLVAGTWVLSRATTPLRQTTGASPASLARAGNPGVGEAWARRRAVTLCARVAGPSAVAENAVLLVSDRGNDRPPVAFWEICCRASGGAYWVRLDAETGDLRAIARDIEGDIEGNTGGDTPGRGGDGDGRTTATNVLSAARAAALARRYLRSAGVAPPPLPPGVRPDVVRFGDSPGSTYAVTFRQESKGIAGGASPSSPRIRVNVDARDGSLKSLYR